MKPAVRIGVLFGVTLYIVSFNIAYVRLIAPRYSYFGLAYSPMDAGITLVTWMLCLAPAAWLPAQIKRPSMILFLTQYVFVYIPASFILHYSIRPKLDDMIALQLQVVMLAGLSIMQVFYYLPLRPIEPKPMSRAAFFYLLLVMAVVPLAYLTLTLGMTFHFTTFGDDNPLFRLEQTSISGSHALAFIGRYGEFWLTNVLLPLFGAIGLFFKRRSLFALVVSGYVLLYGLTSFRSHLLGPIFIGVVYVWSRMRHKYAALFVGLSLSLLWPMATTNEGVNAFTAAWVNMWHVRVISVQGLAVAQYFQFFQYNPITYFTHLKVFDILNMSQYPNLPFTIAIYFYGTEYGANANFWAADGISSLGVFGMPVMSAFCGAVFWLLDCLAARYRLEFVLVSLAFLPITFANISFFTSLLSGGLGLFLLLLYIGPRLSVMKGGLRRRQNRKHTRLITVVPQKMPVYVQWPTRHAAARTGAMRGRKYQDID
jgi:hypothetical protein